MPPTTTPTPRALIEQRQLELGLSDDALAEAVGYKRAVILMLKMGTMRLPLNKVSDFARILQVDAVELLRIALTDGSPSLWDALKPLLPLGELAEHEVNLLRHLRSLSKGRKGAAIVIDGSSIIALVVNP